MSMFFRSVSRAALVLVSATCLTLACDDDEDGDEEHSEEEPAICKEISSVCHDEDMGAGMAQDCHVQAHEGDADLCEMIHDECIAFCTGGGSSGSSG